ncbi:MAG: lantibiotic dehydratase, partial [Mycobacteriales bacterium]
AGERPVDAVARDFAARWAGVFDLAADAGRARLDLTADEVRPRLEAAFPDVGVSWSAAGLHSPDLQVAADGVDALRRGDYLVVLGELHAAWPTFDSRVFTDRHPDPERLRAALAADLGPHRVRLLLPADYPRYTSRLVESLAGPTDRQLAFAATSGADRDRLLPVTAAVVEEVGGELRVRGPDGRTWPVVEVFSGLISMHAVDGLKAVSPLPHTPRVTVDRLVLARETWRTTAGATRLAGVIGERARYLAVRRWRRALDLPERVFVKLGTETKPSYVDLSSPQFAASFAAQVRGAAEAGGEDVPVTVTEMLPAVEQAWLPDAGGRRYSWELRLQVVDPRRSAAGEQA